MADPISNFIALVMAHPEATAIVVGLLGVVVLLFGHGVRSKIFGLILIVAAIAWFTGISALGIPAHFFEVPA